MSRINTQGSSLALKWRVYNMPLRGILFEDAQHLFAQHLFAYQVRVTEGDLSLFFFFFLGDIFRALINLLVCWLIKRILSKSQCLLWPLLKNKTTKTTTTKRNNNNKYHLLNLSILDEEKQTRQHINNLWQYRTRLMVNTSAIWKQAVHNTYLLSYPSCSKIATQNEKYISHRNILVNIFEKKVGRMDH